jgi:ABC-2 type transport system ATP-binding protein
MTQAPMIEAEALTKRFGSTLALDDVTVRAPAGQVLALLGPNGAGKTTLVRVLTTLLTPDSGRARVAGLDVVANASAIRSVIGLAGQYASVDELLTGRENLELAGLLYHLDKPLYRLRAREALERMSLTDAADRPVWTYSGGMRRRLDLAASLIRHPPVLFLDEPTTGLDPEVRRRMWQIVEGLTEEGTTVLLTTHYMDEAQYLASRVIVLADGEIAADATPAELRAKGGPPIIKFRAPQDGPPLPAALSDRTLSGTDDLIALVTWARDNHVDLTGLEVNPPSLEDAYLALTGKEER